jgi:hypothetical protein
MNSNGKALRLYEKRYYPELFENKKEKKSHSYYVRMRSKGRDKEIIAHKISDVAGKKPWLTKFKDQAKKILSGIFGRKG